MLNEVTYSVPTSRFISISSRDIRCLICFGFAHVADVVFPVVESQLTRDRNILSHKIFSEVREQEKGILRATTRPMLLPQSRVCILTREGVIV